MGMLLILLIIILVTWASLIDEKYGENIGETMNKKFAIYCRVSRTDQILENQINPLVQYCERMNWDYEIFKEKESTRKSRPVQWDLYNRLLKKEFDGLLFYKLDRWGEKFKRTCNSHGGLK